MRDARRNYVVTGFFVLVMLAMLLLWLAVLAGRTGAVDSYHLFFSNVSGLGDGALVSFQGYQVGQVEQIGPAPDRGFRVDVSVRRGWRIPEDSVGRITQSGLLSAMVLNIEAGTSARALEPGQTIPSQEAGDLFAELGTLAGEIGTVARSVEPLVEGLSRDVPEIVAEARELVGRLNDAAARLKGLLDDRNTDRVEAILANVDAASSDLATLAANLGDTRQRIDALLAQVDGVVARSGPELEASLVDLHDSLDAAARHADAISHNLESTSRNLNEFSGQVRRDPSLLLRGREEGEEP